MGTKIKFTVGFFSIKTDVNLSDSESNGVLTFSGILETIVF